ncbi:Zinc finger domain-containing protein [Giardia muris]|uniref:Zinc finger domain-containing protein n=1 Tax=Giardia muris TaxID=5742 RepID=A0A4Z1SRG8_GIAMU|nr:Zinc finger domain-containing protein [Giardia muris]|eukprot:TNJ28504.1 Zinc finger domain-containing protein [Giardia muris]
MAVCIICADDYDVGATHPCLHTTCYKCYLINRLSCQRDKCLHCSEPITVTLIYPLAMFSESSLRELVISDRSRRQAGFTFISRYKAHIHSSVMHNVNLFDIPPCPLCSVELGSKGLLKEHMRTEHGKHYCPTCLDSKPCFLQDQPLYSKLELIEHKALHPVCPLCQKSQYDRDAYNDHMLMLHHRCELCRAGGIADSFWLDKAALVEHMSTDHYACDHPTCRDVLIAFATKDELLQHQVEHHPTMFTQQELEQHQLRLFKGKARKRRDVTQEVMLARFSISNRAADLHEAHTFRRRAGHTPAVDDDVLFQMHMKLAIANSLKTAKEEARARSIDAISPTEEYNPATELLMRHREADSITSPITPVEPLPTAAYQTPSSLSVDKPTSIQATLQHILTPSHPPPPQRPGVSIPLTRTQLEERLAANLGVKIRIKKKPKTQSHEEETTQPAIEKPKDMDSIVPTPQQHTSEPEDISKMSLADFGHMDDLAGFPSAPSLISITIPSATPVPPVQPSPSIDQAKSKVEATTAQNTKDWARKPATTKTSAQATHDAFLESIDIENNPQPTTVAPLVIRKSKKKRPQYAD